jgi:hypothetical protein
MAELTAPLPAEASVAVAPPSRRTWDLFSILSVVCGAILIVPFLTGIAAIVLGVMGLRNTGIHHTRGKRLAKVGIILGVVNLVGWWGYFAFVSAMSQPGREAAHRFITDLTSNDPTAAKRDCTGSVSTESLQTAASQIKSWGNIQRVSVLSVGTDNDNGILSGNVDGAITTASSEHSFHLHAVEIGASGWKIREFTFE